MAGHDTPFIAISIATFRRPQGLRALLESINAQEFSGPTPRVEVIVVDNDAENPIYRSHGAVETWCRYPLTYVVEAERGIDSARNRGLDTVPPDADYVVFIDDDERATPNWLESLLRTQRSTGAYVVQGPVIPEYEGEPAAWMREGGFFEMGPFEEGNLLPYAATNNTLVSTQVINREKLRFDRRFNLNGGGDQDFFDRLQDAGYGPIVTSASATVVETVPATRTTFPWIVRRHFRMGNSLGLISRLRGGKWGVAIRVVKACGRLTVGSIRVCAGLVSSWLLTVRGINDIAWGFGSLLAVSGFDYQEYRLRPEYAARPSAADIAGVGERASRRSEA